MTLTFFRHKGCVELVLVAILGCVNPSSCYWYYLVCSSRFGGIVHGGLVFVRFWRGDAGGGRGHDRFVFGVVVALA